MTPALPPDVGEEPEVPPLVFVGFAPWTWTEKGAAVSVKVTIPWSFNEEPDWFTIQVARAFGPVEANEQDSATMFEASSEIV